MRKTEQTPEPSIEEILASIRRIIADDGGPAAGPVFDPFSIDGDDAHTYFGSTPDFPLEERQAAALARSISSDTAIANGPRREDEILELTEDFMVEELAEIDAAYSSNSASRPVLPGRDNASAEYFHVAAAPGTVEVDADDLTDDHAAALSGESLEDLNTVLSNVAAEMHRLAEGHGLEIPVSAPPAAPAPMVARPAAAAMPAPAVVKPAVTASAAPAAPKQQSAPPQKPVWSARHQSEASKGRGANGRTDAGYDTPLNGMSTSASPLMEAIATSLVTALADSSASGSTAATPAVAPPPAPAAVALAPASVAEIMPPDDEFAPDTDGSLFDAPDTIAAPSPSAATANGASEIASDMPTAATASPSAPAVTAVASVSTSPAAPVALPSGMDDKVREMLKPLIVGWLNEHLPRLVEKALREEIAAHGSLSLRSNKSGSSHG